MKRIAIALVAVGLLGGTAIAANAGGSPSTPNGVFYLSKHSVATLSNATFEACNDLRYGYQVAGGPLTLVGVKPVGCTGPQGVPTSGATIGPFKTNTTFRVFLIDHSCPAGAGSDTGPGTTYYSDHTSTSTNPSADHALVTGTNPRDVKIMDANLGCGNTSTNSVPTTIGNVEVTVTTGTPRPTGV